MSKGGKIVEIIEGSHKGQYGQVPNDRQHASFQAINKVFIEFYEDMECTKPIMQVGKKVVGLISVSYLHIIGFYD